MVRRGTANPFSPVQIRVPPHQQMNLNLLFCSGDFVKARKSLNLKSKERLYWKDFFIVYRKQKVQKNYYFFLTRRQEYNILSPNSFRETIGKGYELNQIGNKGM